MSPPRSDFVRELVGRGFVHQATDLDGIDALAAKGRLTAYIGFDCTADSLHVGNLVGIMMLRWLQRTGHRPIALIGGGTSKVGDPSGKDESRQLLDDATLAANRAGIRRSLEGFLEFGDACRTGPTTAVGPGSQARGEALLVDNGDWLDQLRYIPFLRTYGRHFTINRMLTFDSVKLRLEREQPLTFLEFNYMVMQAYDFMELARRHDCRLQMGGSDQWGNIVNGVELGRRAEGLELYGLTTPLITTSSGVKMGKTAQGAVWLNEDRLSHFDYWQYWRNVDDADVGRFLRLFTELPVSEIERLERARGRRAERGQEDPGARGDGSAGAVPRHQKSACTIRASSMPDRNRAHRSADVPRAELAQGCQRRGSVSKDGSRRQQRRGAAADPGRRRPAERAQGRGRDHDGRARRPGRRPAAALGRQEAPRPGARRLA